MMFGFGLMMLLVMGLPILALVFLFTGGIGYFQHKSISMQQPAAAPVNNQAPQQAASPAGPFAHTCSHCGAGLQPDWTHCPQCGAPVQ